jgi:hypothetical protein
MLPKPAVAAGAYERNGTATLFMLFAPLEGWRHVKVTDRHTAIDYACVLSDEIAAWEHDRNAQNTKSDWHFATKDVRTKLNRLYPSI